MIGYKTFYNGNPFDYHIEGCVSHGDIGQQLLSTDGCLRSFASQQGFFALINPVRPAPRPQTKPRRAHFEWQKEQGFFVQKFQGNPAASVKMKIHCLDDH